MQSEADTLLSGLRVLQCDEHLTTAFAGHLLQLLGARVDVLQVERSHFEGPDPLYEALRLNKGAAANAKGYDLAIAGPASAATGRGLVLGLPVAEARFFDDPELDALPMSELTLLAASGWLSLVGDPAHDFAPIKPSGFQASLQCGVLLATLGLAAYSASRAAESPAHIVLSMRAFIIALLNALPAVSYSGEPLSRAGVTTAQPDVIVACLDGYLYLSCVEERQWLGLCEVMGNPDWARSPAFADRWSRYENWEALHALLGHWAATQRRMDVYTACAATGNPSLPILDVDEFAALPQFADRNVLLPPSSIAGMETRLPRLPWLWQPETATRSSAQHQSAGPQANAPLHDLHVLDLSWVWAGPFAAELLGYLGADVIKVESFTQVDYFRRASARSDSVQELNTSAVFNQLNQEKRSIALDFQQPDDQHLLDGLLTWADVLVSNFRPGVLDQLGIAGRAAGRGLVQAAISGYGATPPWSARSMYGKGAVALSGLVAATGQPDGAPLEVGFAYGDPCSANYAALAIMAGLLARERTGTGYTFDISLAEAILCTNTDLMLRQEPASRSVQPKPNLRMGNRHPVFTPHGVFRCLGDDEWIAISVGSDRQWQALASHVSGLASVEAAGEAERRTRESAIEAAIAAWTVERPAAAVADILQRAGIAAWRVQHVHEQVHDPTLRRANLVHDSAHPVAGTRTMLGVPWRVNGVRPVPSAAPMLDGDRESVVGTLEPYKA